MTALITRDRSKMVRNTELAFRELRTEGVALGGHDHDLHFQSRQPRRCVVLSSGSRSACGLRSASLTGPEMLSHHYLSSVSAFTLHCVQQQTRTGPWFILETTRTKCSCVASNTKPLRTLIPVTTVTPSWNKTMKKNTWKSANHGVSVNWSGVSSLALAHLVLAGYKATLQEVQHQQNWPWPRVPTAGVGAQEVSPRHTAPSTRGWCGHRHGTSPTCCECHLHPRWDTDWI